MAPRLSMLSLLLVLAGCPTAAPVCEAGRTVDCACVGGRVGAQTCRGDGTRWEPCQCPVQADAGVAVVVDAGTAAGDAGAPDAGSSLVQPGADCVFPDRLATVAPTSGRCDGNAAIACDQTLSKMVKVDCGTLECREVPVRQPGSNATTPPTPEWTYTWASCAPPGAATCPFAYSEARLYWEPSGGVYLRCASSSLIEVCRMPIPDPPFPSNAGTPEGYWQGVSCRADETCRVQGGEGQCTVGDVLCAGWDATCESDSLLRNCEEDRYPVRSPCGAGFLCRPRCGGGANCLEEAFVNDPGLCVSGTASRCTDDKAGVVFCDESVCFDRGGSCVCSVGSYACTGGQTCVKHTYLDGSVVEECGWDVDCTPGDRCRGDEAVLCTGDWAEVHDCARLGMTCAAEGGSAGCVAGTATCDSAEAPGCSAPDTVDLCCPDHGLANVGSGSYPCVPGRRFTMKCPTTPLGSYQCQSGACVFPF